MFRIILGVILGISYIHFDPIAENNLFAGERKKYNEKCWSQDNEATLIGLMNTVVKTPLEIVYKNDDYIQTFGCAYEDDDIEQNSIRSVHRAIDQSLRNRGITAIDNIAGLLRSRPPRPDNLSREYTIYVNLEKNSKVQHARYEVKILNLQVAATFESKRSVWTRIITRYAYQDDFKNAAAPREESSEFFEIMLLAEDILELAGKGKFKKVDELISRTKRPAVQPSSVDELVFADYMTLFSKEHPKISGIYLGKGTYLARIPDFGTTILKFGEEHLFGLRLDTNSFHRSGDLFSNLQYRAPESVLQCLLLRFEHKKPLYLPSANASR